MTSEPWTISLIMGILATVFLCLFAREKDKNIELCRRHNRISEIWHQYPHALIFIQYGNNTFWFGKLFGSSNTSIRFIKNGREILEVLESEDENVKILWEQIRLTNKLTK